MSNNSIRKCAICEKEIDITKDDYLKKVRFMHADCYKLKYSKKFKGLINEQIQLIRDQMSIEKKEQDEKILEKERKSLEAKKKELERNNNRNLFINYIKETYDITTIPKHFYIKLSSINNGTYQGMSEGITYEDLLYIFQRKQRYFDTVCLRNTSKGKEIKGIGRVNYDLAIAINLYDEYKEWKRKQQILASDTINQVKTEENKPKIDFSKIKSNVNDDSDLSDVIDELY